MSDFLLIAILVAFFAFAIALVQVLGRMIDRDAGPGGLANEPPDTDGPPDHRLDGQTGGLR
jgi:hypothetical protein